MNISALEMKITSSAGLGPKGTTFSFRTLRNNNDDKGWVPQLPNLQSFQNSVLCLMIKKN
ncbi:hypothetical protein NQ317_006592 [Molorchus minor]|uniref:Uncharacterized protein n=1 Tax=Molorchus minor TaxID=1323400 RepID=A0ABQ9K093_9CUCU|nr:hypothetical protein NQ317_006592 [Molorchus minor]